MSKGGTVSLRSRHREVWGKEWHWKRNLEGSRGMCWCWNTDPARRAIPIVSPWTMGSESLWSWETVNKGSVAKSPPRLTVLVLSHFSRVWLCDSMDCSPPGFSVHGNLQARILEWVAMPSSRGSSTHGNQTCISYISCTGRQVLYH